MAANAALVLSEPEPETRAFLERHLVDDGFELLPASNGVRPDLVLLADATALDEWRERDVPVIVLGAAEADAIDRARALDRGCDDFVPRPFVYDELLARIRAVLRRTGASPAERIEAGPIVADRATRRVTAAGRPVALAAKEYELLLYLAADPYRVFTKDQLLREVWGFRSHARTRTLDSHASRLRRKLTEAGGVPCVINEWGVGYRLLADEAWVEASERAA